MVALLLPKRAFEVVKKWGWAAILVAIAVLGIAAAYCDIVDHDEVQHLHASWLITQGQKPYTDFFEHHPPLYWQTAGRLVHALYNVPSVTVFRTARLLAAAIAVLAAAGLVWLARELKACSTYALAPLLVYVWVHPAFEFRPDGAAALFSVVAAAALARAVRRDSVAWAAASGVGLSLAAGLVIKVWAVGLVWLLVLVWLVIRHRSGGGWRLCLAAMGGAAAAGVAALAHALWVADWPDMWRCVIEANVLRQKVLTPLPWSGYLKLLALVCPALVVALIVAAVHIRGVVRSPLLGVAGVGFAASIVAIAAQQRPSMHYFLPPVMASGVMLMLLERHIRERGLTWWYGKAVLAVVLGLSLGRTWVYVEGLRGNFGAIRKQYDGVMATVIEHVEPGQKVIASIPIHPIWAFDSAGWFCPQIMRAAGAEAGWWPRDPRLFAAKLMSDPPDVVIAPAGQPGVGWNDDVLVQPNFRQWVSDNYRAATSGGFWQRRYAVWTSLDH
jgi:hypothetical protein